MNITQITKAIAPLVKLAQQEAAIESKQLKSQLQQLHQVVAKMVSKEAVAPLVAENKHLKVKLRKALEQRDEWRYHARKYRIDMSELRPKK